MGELAAGLPVDTLPMVDGLVFACDGWSEALAESGVAAIHVTVGDFLGDFSATCSGIAKWNRILERDSKHLYKVSSVSDLYAIGTRPGVGVIFGLQNAAPLGTDIKRVDELWQLGIRVLQLTYNHANLVGDGCLEDRDGGLTNFGVDVVRECNRVGMVVDLSHVGERSSLDAIEAAAVPVVSTHANIRELAPSLRNKSEHVLGEIVGSGGYVGISPYGPMCWDGVSARPPDVTSFVQQLQRATDLFGPEHVGIGTDYGIAKDMSMIDGVLARSLERFPEIFGQYANVFGNEFKNRYCAGLGSIRAWNRMPEILTTAGFDRQARRRILGQTLIETFAEIWKVRDA